MEYKTIGLNEILTVVQWKALFYNMNFKAKSVSLSEKASERTNNSLRNRIKCQ